MVNYYSLEYTIRVSIKVLKSNIQKFWPWAIIFLILVRIWLSSIDLTQWLIGWDNFSVSLDLNTNFFRTIFSSWRGYRGLGVPSDSESVDVFRILFQGFLSAFLPINLLDQFYYLSLYSIGFIGIYLLANDFLKSNHVKEEKNSLSIALASLIAALSYAFNFHVVETFFLPVAMYPARYAFFPLILWSFLRIIHQSKPSLRNIGLFVIFNLLGSVAYLTATVFITLGIVFATVLPSYFGKWRRFILVGLGIVAINSFWVLPFANYTVQKAEILPKASSFVDVNESLLNKPAEDFSWSDLLSYYPLTVTDKALPFTNLQNGNPELVHPLVNSENKIARIYFIPTLIGLLGVVVLIFRKLRLKSAVKAWPILTVVLTLFLLRKNLPPFGLFYQFIENNIPFFAIVFRFGGAKFFPILLLGMTLLIGYGTKFLIDIPRTLFKSSLLKLTQVILAFGLGVIVISPFITIFNQGLFSDLVRVEVPEAYFQMADVINSQPEYGRVLHLPIDQFSYWKSYSWGYFGSTFLTFMIDKPFMDRTFEPASQENDFFFRQLQQEVMNTSYLSAVGLNQHVARIEKLFKITGVDLILTDSSISNNLLEENLHTWGVFNELEWDLIMDWLVRDGGFSLARQLAINNDSQNFGFLNLYRRNEEYSIARFIGQATNIDPELDNGFATPILEMPNDVFQSQDRPFISFPFWQPKTVLEKTASSFSYTLPLQHQNKLDFYMSSSERDEVFYNIYFSRNDREIIFFFHPQWIPIATAFNPEQVDNIVFEIPTDQELAVAVADDVIAIPVSRENEVTFLGTFLLEQEEEFSLLAKQLTNQVTVEQINLSENPNCYQDAKPGYVYSFDKSDGEINLTTQQGMTCLSMPLVFATEENQEETASKYYFATSIDFESDQEGFHRYGEGQDRTVLQNNIRKNVLGLSDYSVIELCMINPATGECLNQAQYLSDSNSNSIVFTKSGIDLPYMQLLLILHSQPELKSKLAINKVNYDVYSELAKTTYQRIEQIPAKLSISTTPSEELTLQIPYSINTDLFSLQKQALRPLANPCTEENNYDNFQFFKTDEQGRILSYLENCWGDLYTTTPIEGNKSYLWLAKYKLFVGKHPKFSSRQNTQEIYNEYFSRFNLYPNVPGFKDLQQANKWVWNSDRYQKFISEELAEDDYIWEQVVVDPLDMNIGSSVSFQVNHSGEGQGIIGIEDMSILELPQQWRNLRIETGESEFDFQPLSVSEVKSILPSLWRIKINTLANNIDPISSEALLEFGQAYDEQWQLYKTNNWLLAFIGFGKVDAEHVRVNGWSNGWIIESQDLVTENDELVLYAFYTPERLAWIGWGITIGTISGIFYWIVRKTK